MFIMDKAQTEITKLKCRDCCKCDNAGWGQYFCEQTPDALTPGIRRLLENS